MLKSNERWYLFWEDGGWFRLRNDRLLYKPLYLLRLLYGTREYFKLDWTEWASEENLTDEDREDIERLRDIEDYLQDWP